MASLGGLPESSNSIMRAVYSPSGHSSTSSMTARTTALTASYRGSGSKLPLHHAMAFHVVVCCATYNHVVIACARSYVIIQCMLLVSILFLFQTAMVAAHALRDVLHSWQVRPATDHNRCSHPAFETKTTRCSSDGGTAQATCYTRLPCPLLADTLHTAAAWQCI